MPPHTTPPPTALNGGGNGNGAARHTGDGARAGAGGGAAARRGDDVVINATPQPDNPYKVVRRNGSVVAFDREKIHIAMSKAFIAVRGPDAARSTQIRDQITRMSSQVIASLTRKKPYLATFHIEDIQDQVELALMREECHDVARAYVLYREERAKERKRLAASALPADMPEVEVTAANGARHKLDIAALAEQIKMACAGLPQVKPDQILRLVIKDLYTGISTRELETALYMASRGLISLEPEYAQVSARLLLDALRNEVIGRPTRHDEMAILYPEHFLRMLREGVDGGRLNPALQTRFDLPRLARALSNKRDLQFNYLGLQTLYDRYFVKVDGRRIEMPQTFFMRVAMGLALNEKAPTERAVEFYELLSSFAFMSSTPTLFNSGTRHSQLSSCYLSTVGDDLKSIFTAYQENALLAKFAGGLGNDWTPVRAMGAHIKGTNGSSQGVIPFLKIVNDTAVAVNQGGKRKGAVCVYLETWHLDILDFIELRKNTGDERRRAHDMNTANWIPDLFMKRVIADGDWTLFSPSDVPDLHDLYGAAFEARYAEYEAQVDAKALPGKRMKAVDLWRKMLGMLFETGHPWMTFKDACNVRSPQNHRGVVHSSNLCTEITLNTDADEIAVCNLGSVNLPAHLTDGNLDRAKLARTVKTAMRMLDNVIDINYYAVDKARNSNRRHRPVGLGMMGFQDCLYEMNIAYDSDAAVQFADESAEALCYEAYWASTELAEERGAYESFDGSLWARGILPIDSLRALARERGDAADGGDALLPGQRARLAGEHLSADVSMTLDWATLRERIQKVGMRNSNCVAIAPTATIANIVGVTASIEPTYQNIFVKSNLSGDFTVSNRYLVDELKARGLWDNVMLEEITYFDGMLSRIDRVPAEIRDRFPTAFEIDPKWLVECAARRQKWIDQAQSLNLYVAQPSGKKVDELYRLAWQRGLKTTYYLRTMAASSTEKYTARAGAHNAVSATGATSAVEGQHQDSSAGSSLDSSSTASSASVAGGGAAAPGISANGIGAMPPACIINDPECEACQ